MNNCSTAVLKIRSEMKVLFAVGKVKILQTRLYEPARLSTPPKPLFSLKLLDDAIWLRSFIIYGEYLRRDFFSRKRSLPMYETLKKNFDWLLKVLLIHRKMPVVYKPESAFGLMYAYLRAFSLQLEQCNVR